MEFKIGEAVHFGPEDKRFKDTVTYLIAISDNPKVKNKYTTVSICNNNIEKYLNGEEFEVVSWDFIRKVNLEQ